VTCLVTSLTIPGRSKPMALITREVFLAVVVVVVLDET
jgi:hypothetical protein